MASVSDLSKNKFSSLCEQYNCIVNMTISWCIDKCAAFLILSLSLVISETSLSRHSIALLLTTKQQQRKNTKHKIPNTNKLS